MTWVALCSAKGSPGTTTLACALGAVWPSARPVVVIECDPLGGDVAGRFGLSSRVGMTSLVLTGRQGHLGPLDHGSHVQRLPGGLGVLVGPTAAESALTLDRELAMSTSDLVGGDSDVIADCGRLLPGAGGQARMLARADRVILLLRPDVTGVAHARAAMERLAATSTSPPAAVVSSGGDFKASEVEQVLEARVLGVLPDDLAGARMAGGGSGRAREFLRSPLVGFARDLVDVLASASAVDHRRPERRDDPRRHDELDRDDGEKRPKVWRRQLPRWPGSSNGKNPRLVAP